MSRKINQRKSRVVKAATPAGQTSGPRWMLAAAGAIALTAVAAWWTAPQPAGQAPTVPVPAVATQPTVAAPAPQAASRTRREAPAAPATQATGSFDAGQRAFIDPATGRLRPMEHDDVLPVASQGQAQRRSARGAQAQETFALSVETDLAVPESLDTFTVATKGPDGKVSIGHAAGPKAATKMTSVSKSAKSNAKEDRNDR